MVRCWEIAPTSRRVVQDIQGLPNVCEKILENDGCVVPDEDFRTGKRARGSSTATTDEKSSASRKRYRRKDDDFEFDLHEDALPAVKEILETSGIESLAEHEDVADHLVDDYISDAIQIASRVC
mmetsp:Transcript_32977/g.61492  ORF Transcript_32977/g.61492 Transcript_32977/m.61492 type:complete len:124 (-) Transcript_32977:25-396(-)